MNRVAVGAFCLACLFSVIEAKRARNVLAACVLEQMERVFDTVESVLHPA